MIVFSGFIFCILLSLMFSNADLGGVPRNYSCSKCKPNFYTSDTTTVPQCSNCGELMTECDIH